MKDYICDNEEDTAVELVKEVAGAIAFVAALALFFAAYLYCTPYQPSAEAEYWKAQLESEVVE